MNDAPEHLEPLSDLIERFDHVAFGVHDLAESARLFEWLGGVFEKGGDNRAGGFRWVQFRLPDGNRIEVLSPIEDDSFLWRFLRSRGEGVHHLTFKVSSAAEAARRAEEAGLKVVGLHVEPGGWSECFIHPSTAHGALIQLAEWPDYPAPPSTLEDVLAGRGIIE